VADLADRPVLRPDQVTSAVLVPQMSPDETHAAITVCRAREKRSHDKPPAHMTTCLTPPTKSQVTTSQDDPAT
jgi:hypothetical protein